MIINSNQSANFASRISNINAANVQKNMNELASGRRINSAKDDASGLAVSTKMKAQIRGLGQSSKNISDGASMLNVASGYMQETTDILQRIRELAVQSSNGIYSDEDRRLIQIEVSQLVTEIDRIASSAQFNGMNLLTGRFSEDFGAITLQVGANMDQNVSFNLNAVTAESLGLKNIQDSGETISIADRESANATIGVVDEALKNVSKQQALVGANQNRIEQAKNGIDIAYENMTAANSRIEDADMASSVVEFTKSQILEQASVAMLSQANSNNSNVLSLLR